MDLETTTTSAAGTSTAVAGSDSAPANPFVAGWTGSADEYCSGQWDIRYRGRPLRLDPLHGGGDMGTFGIFSRGFPDDGDLAEGLPEDDWIVENVIWLSHLFVRNAVPIDEAHMRWFYQAVNVSDWRCGDCSGACVQIDNREGSVPDPHVAQKAPYAVAVEAGKTYTWCACGQSKTQPFCDGSHQGSAFTPLQFTAEKSEQVWLCGCKHSGHKPMCDGSHKKLA